MSTITTFSGESFTPLTPDMAQVHMKDIAHALSLLCRANGHFVRFFSVAQHSIRCAVEAAARGHGPRVQLACLLHDASEAYLSDITRPIKKHLPLYVEAEDRLQNAIYCKYLNSPLSPAEHDQVRQVDDDMLEAEFAVLLDKRPIGRVVILASQPTYEFEAFEAVESQFIQLFESLLQQL